MYINYLNKELFYSSHAGGTSGGTSDCNIVFDPEPIGSCANYSNTEYTKMREDYWAKIEDKYDDSACQADIIQKIKDNNKESLAMQKTLIENKKKMEELQTNIVASEQRLSDSKKNNYRNKVKLIIFIVAIIVFVLIELILILV